MEWNLLSDIHQLNTIDEESKLIKVLLFKHSTRCSISDTALGRIERKWKEEYKTVLKVYFLDLIANRNLSDTISQHYSIRHQSPQALVISHGKCVFEQTHSEISLEDILKN